MSEKDKKTKELQLDRTRKGENGVEKCPIKCGVHYRKKRRM
jgi:hypothetical protein